MKPHARLIALPLLAAAGLLVAVAPGASARQAPERAAAHVVVSASFERSLAGWAGYRARLERTRGGIAGRWALRVTFRNVAPDTGFSAYATTPQATTVAGATYTGSAWVKASASGRTLCLRVRERAGATETGGATGCLTSNRAWQQFAPVSYTAATSGRSVDVYVYEWTPKRHDSFSVDQLTLTTTAPPATTTTTTTTTPAPSGPTPWYSGDSPFNQPVSADAPTDPNSAAMVQALAAGAGGGFAISAKQWTAPVYYADATTPHIAVSLTMSWFPAKKLIGVPMPADAAPDSTSDGHLMIVDRSTSCEYDFWQAHKNADGSWSASTANAIPMNGDGIFAGGWATTAAGFALGLGKIRPEEMAAGTIAHALVFAFPTTKAGGPVAPATSSDGKSSAAGAIPEGARLQLDPALDLDSLGLNAWQKTIARALQRYGMVLGDSGGTVGLSAVNASNLGANAYPWGDLSYAYLPTALLTHFRVLTVGAQSSPPGQLIPTSCATYGF